MSARQKERAAHEQRVVGEQRELRVNTASDQERRGEAAADGHRGEPDRALSIGEPCGCGGYRNHQRESRGLTDQAVVAESGVDREKQRRDAAAGDHLPVDLIAATCEAVAGKREPEAHHDAEGDAHRLGNPLVVEGVFQEERDAEDQHDSAHPQHQAAADGFFETLGVRRHRGWRVRFLR